MTGSPYFLAGDGVRNQFLIRIINKENAPEIFQVRLRGDVPGMQFSGTEELVPVEALGEQLRPLVVTVPRARYHQGLLATRRRLRQRPFPFRTTSAGPRPVLPMIKAIADRPWIWIIVAFAAMIVSMATLVGITIKYPQKEISVPHQQSDY